MPAADQPAKVAAPGESLRSAIDIATPAERHELIGMLIERVKVTGDGVSEAEPTPAARSFFAAAGRLSPAPRTVLGPQQQRSVLACYLEVG